MPSFETLIQSERPVFVDFYADWCNPCQTMAPILKDVKLRVGQTVAIVKVNVDENQQAASAYKINSVPTLLLFKRG